MVWSCPENYLKNNKIELFCTCFYSLSCVMGDISVKNSSRSSKTSQTSKTLQLSHQFYQTRFIQSRDMLENVKMSKLTAKFQMNKAGYTATEVACGWAGAIFEVTSPFRQQQWSPKIKIIKKVKCDQPTDRPTKRGVESRSTRLKRMKKKEQKL